MPMGEAFHTLETEVGTDGLSHLEQVVNALQHDGIHAESHCTLDTRILAVALQHVADLRAAERGGRINIGNRTARARLDGLELHRALFGGEDAGAELGFALMGETVAQAKRKFSKW